jgi:hypothetical protein
MPNKCASKHHIPLKSKKLAIILGGVFCFVVLSCFLISLVINPKITHGEFPFHLVYEVDGKQYTINDTIICDYAGIGMDEGNGIYINWKERLANREISKNYQYGIELFDGVIQGDGTLIVCDIGNPQYYLGYNKFTDYCPGRVSISSPTINGVLSNDELWNKYNIKIIEESFSQPMVGNGIPLSPLR